MSITKLNNRSLTAVTALPSGVGGKVLQVVNATAGASNTSSSSYVTTDCTLSITPSSTSNKILLLGSVNCANSGSFYVNLKFYRNGSDVSGVVAAHYSGNNAQNTMMYLDSPSSTSALTYAIFFNASGSTAYLNFQSMTAIEIAG
jgi:hypothetical protein